jgi:beta-lactamase regulating signal transducer with metallopeptidase domain
VIRFALPVLFEAVLRALVAACILWIALRLLRVTNVRAQKAAWSVMLLAGIALPLVTLSHWIPAWAEVRLPAPSWSRLIPTLQSPVNVVQSVASPADVAHPVASPAQSFATAPELTPVAPETASLPHSRAVNFEILPDHATVSGPSVTPPPAAAPTAPAPHKNSRFPLDPIIVAWFLYLAISAALLFRWFIGIVSSTRLWFEATPVEAAEFGDMNSAIATRSSSRIFSPVNIGSGIVLPADYQEWPPEKLRAVLAHEGSHVRQRDFYLQLLAGLYAALTWFSPLGWWLKRKLSELSEAISDRAGLEESRSRSAYAQLLLEFAALPRPTLTGVAMARSNNLSHRIDRLLNESSFKQAFTGSRRAFVAALIVPALLVATTALFRVEAAAAPGQANLSQVVMLSKDQMPSFSTVTGEPRPAPPQTADSSPTQTPPPAAVPSPNPTPEPAPVPPMPSADAQAAPAAPPLPPSTMELIVPQVPPVPPVDVEVQVPPVPQLMLFMHDYEGHAKCFADGDAYAIVGDPGTPSRFCGNTRGEMEAEVEKARATAHGHFLLFRHDGKYYVVDDPAIVSQIEDMDKNMHDQSEQMRALGEQLRDSSRQIRDEARDEARKATAAIPAPDLSKEMADLNATVASLTAKQGATVSREELQQVQREISEIQRRVIEAEVNTDMKEFNSEFDAKFKAEADKFKEQMSQMGSQLGQTVQQDQQKINSIIDDSLKSGKAKPVN